MSVEAIARVTQIQQMLATLQGVRVAPAAQPATAPQGAAAAAPASFSSVLTQAMAPTATGATALPGGVPYAAEISASAQRNGLDPALLAGLIKQESGFDPSAGSGAGAVGLTQLMPGTASALGVTNPLDPAQSIEGGARYLKQQLDHFGGDTSLALAAYNAGPGAVQRFGGIPPYAETQHYVAAVLANASAFGGAA